jgi:hypothetical protein
MTKTRSTIYPLTAWTPSKRRYFGDSWAAPGLLVSIRPEAQTKGNAAGASRCPETLRRADVTLGQVLVSTFTGLKP